MLIVSGSDWCFRILLRSSDPARQTALNTRNEDGRMGSTLFSAARRETRQPDAVPTGNAHPAIGRVSAQFGPASTSTFKGTLSG
jgi:hypothetical protein